MENVKAGIHGSTPALAVKPVDQTLPACAKPTSAGSCTRKAGHYGPCGVAK
jgi:hypothetical protein